MEFWRTQIEILYDLKDGRILVWVAGRSERAILIYRYVMVGIPDDEIYMGKILHAKVNLEDNVEELIFKEWEVV